MPEENSNGFCKLTFSDGTREYYGARVESFNPEILGSLYRGLIDHLVSLGYQELTFSQLESGVARFDGGKTITSIYYAYDPYQHLTKLPRILREDWN
tara:strand:+ start:280 stop:570 length:291 start_codon:yes stop_codon:yes gene_type:complete